MAVCPLCYASIIKVLAIIKKKHSNVPAFYQGQRIIMLIHFMRNQVLGFQPLTILTYCFTT